MKKGSLLSKYIILTLAVFCGTAIISVLVRLLFVSDAFPWNVSDDAASLIAALIEGMIACVATSLVFYQLKIGNEAEKQQSNINEASFIAQYNQAFIQDPNMWQVERLLEEASEGKAATPIITDENRQTFINYLVYLESVAPLILTDVLKLSHVDDLFAYRFFLAMNNPEVQRDQLFQYPDYYRGCFKLYDKWKKYRVDNAFPILQEETGLDKWPYHKAFSNNEVIVRPLKGKNESKADKKKIAALIYQTDKYIYPALFGTKANAKRRLPPMMQEKCVFHYSNIRVAELNGKIVGVAVVLDKQPEEDIDLSHLRMKSAQHVFEHYFRKENHFGKKNASSDSAAESNILCLCVDPKARGKGVGRTLLAAVMHEKRQRRIVLTVLKENDTACSLYEKHGFEKKEALGGYAYKGKGPDCFKMVKESEGENK